MKAILPQIAIFALITFTGCSFLSGGAVLSDKVVQLDNSLLSCKANPEIVDGDISTSSTLDTLDMDIGAEYRGVVASSSGMVIKLDKPTYITSVEVYPEIKDPKVYISAMSPESEKVITFDRILDPIDKSVQEKSPTTLKINKEILFIIITAKKEVDTTKAVELDSRTGERIVQTKGATVNEVKFYTYSTTE